MTMAKKEYFPVLDFKQTPFCNYPVDYVIKPYDTVLEEANLPGGNLQLSFLEDNTDEAGNRFWAV
jgi:hypothetical protein